MKVHLLLCKERNESTSVYAKGWDYLQEKKIRQKVAVGEGQARDWDGKV
jgi:hypothetical protein